MDSVGLRYGFRNEQMAITFFSDGVKTKAGEPVGLFLIRARIFLYTVLKDFILFSMTSTVKYKKEMISKIHTAALNYEEYYTNEC